MKLPRQSLFFPFIILIIFSILVLPTLNRQGVGWDEQDDVNIARSYISRPGSWGWLYGSSEDPSQTRLPMFTVAIAFLITRTDSLSTARILSFFVSIFTLVGIYLYCKLRFTQLCGMIAISLLVTSPFFLSYSRVALTESDIFPACMLAWLLVSETKYEDEPNLGWLATCSVIIGMAISSKFTMIALIPAVSIIILLLTYNKKFENIQEKANSRERSYSVKNIKPIITIIFTSLLIAMILIFKYPIKEHGGFFRLVLYTPFASLWFFSLIWSLLKRKWIIDLVQSIGFLIGFSLLTFLVVPPEHLTNPDILLSLLGRLEDEMLFNISFVEESAALHLLSIIFKSGFVIGIGMVFSFIISVSQWKNKKYQFLVIVFLLYFGTLILLPLAQPFYTVPLLPILAVLSANQFIKLLHRNRQVALATGLLAIGLLAYDFILCYPDYNLNGYQWLGARTLAGRSTIGYRSIVQTPSDGVEQSIQWLNENAHSGERVLAIISPSHIIEEIAPNPVYDIVVISNTLQIDSRKLLNADYIVVHINEIIRHGWGSSDSIDGVFDYPYDPTFLQLHFDKVFAINRAFGIEMSSVWKKK